MKVSLAAIAGVVLVGGALFVALPAVAASAVSAAPTPVSGKYVDYSGTSTSSVPGHPGAIKASDGVFPATARVDCTQLPCRLVALVIDDHREKLGVIAMTEGRTLELVNGQGTFAMAGFGKLCDNVSLPPGTLTVTATATQFSATRTGPAQSQPHCPDGSSIEAPAFVLTFAMKVSGGEPCVVDDSCQKPSGTPTALANAGTPGHLDLTPRPVNAKSVLSVLPTVTAAFTVRNAVWAAAAAVVLVLLIAIPTHFFNQAAAKASELIEAWWKRRKTNRPGLSALESRASRAGRAVELAGWPAAAGGVVAASIISSFVDPRFGFDPASIRTFLSILTSFLLDVVIGWFAVLLIVRKTHPQSTARFEFKPLTLVIVVVAVLFTRLTSFQPGIVFGLVAGVAFGGLLATAEKARVALIGLGYSFGIGLLAWIGYTALSATSGSPDAVTIFVRETLSGIAIAGSSSLPIALLPIRGLTGATVWEWKRWVWALGYAIGLFGFMVMLMPMPFSWEKVPINLIVWIGAYVAYAAVAVGVWLALERPWRKPVETVSA